LIFGRYDKHVGVSFWIAMQRKISNFKLRIANFSELGVLSISAVSFSFNVWNDWNVWNGWNPRNAVRLTSDAAV